MRRQGRWMTHVPYKSNFTFRWPVPLDLKWPIDHQWERERENVTATSGATPVKIRTFVPFSPVMDSFIWPRESYKRIWWVEDPPNASSLCCSPAERYCFIFSCSYSSLSITKWSDGVIHQPRLSLSLFSTSSNTSSVRVWPKYFVAKPIGVVILCSSLTLTSGDFSTMVVQPNRRFTCTLGKSPFLGRLLSRHILFIDFVPKFSRNVERWTLAKPFHLLLLFKTH